MKLPSPLTIALCLGSLLCTGGLLHAQQTESALARRVQQLRNQQTTTASQNVANNPAYEAMLPGVVLIRCANEDGEYSGTGWIVDVDQRLIVTNHHVVEYFIECHVYFPEYTDGQLVTDAYESVVPERAHRARVVDVSPQHDLALLQLDDELPQGATALEIAETTPAPGSPVHSIAGSTVGAQSLWVYSTGHVRQSVRGEMANGWEAMLLESDMATNQGNSGGPVCNDQGQVVAVVEGHTTNARLVSIYIGLESLLEYLGDALRCVEPKSVEDFVFAIERQLFDGRPNPALELVNQAMELDPGSAELMCLRGWCWYYNGDCETAQADFEEAIELDKKFADAYAGLAAIASDANNYESAIKHYTNAVRNDPNNGDYLLERGKVRRLMGEYEAAIRDFNAALRKDEYNLEAVKHRGYCLIDTDQLDKGLEDLEYVVEYNADDFVIFHYYGKATLRQENYEQAILFFQTSLNLNPDNAEAHCGLGLAFAESGDASSAISAFEAAINLAPYEASYHFFLGLQRIAAGLEGGEESLARASELAPENDAFREAYEEHANSSRADRNPVLVSTKALAAEYVGDWISRVRRGSDLIEIQLSLAANGEYSLHAVTTSNGQVSEETTDRGNCRVENGNLVSVSSLTGEESTAPIKWQGGQLFVYLKELNGWLSFGRDRS